MMFPTLLQNCVRTIRVQVKQNLASVQLLEMNSPMNTESVSLSRKLLVNLLG